MLRTTLPCLAGWLFVYAIHRCMVIVYTSHRWLVGKRPPVERSTHGKPTRVPVINTIHRCIV
eukprot:1290863-Lingulodinium_polyedra.AAC.1